MKVGRIGLSAVVAVLAGVPPLVWWSDLPDRVAIHWGLDGVADGSAGRALGIGGPAVVALALAVALFVLLGRPGARHHVAAPLVGFLGGLLAALSTLTVLANRDVAAWSDAELSMWATVLATAVGVGVAAGAVALLREHTATAVPSATAASARPPAGASTARVAWSGTAQSGWAIGAGLLLGLLTGIALVIAGSYPMAVVVFVVEVGLVLACAQVRVTVGSHGLTARSPIGWPVVTIPIEEIESAEAATIEPMAWGGWGFRGSLRVLGRAAWVLRRGEGVVLHLSGGRSFAVTVDGADAAAEVVNESLTLSSSPRMSVPTSSG